MSIIERAIEKLGANEQPKSKAAVKKREESAVARQVVKSTKPDNEKQSSMPIPELDDSVAEKYHKPVRSKSVQRTDKKRHSMEEMTSFEPEIFISKLNVEGILSPKGGRSRLAEEYRLIKRPLLVKAFSDVNENASNTGVLHNNVIMISSSVAGEGKTFTSLNLAISIAMEMDQTVLLIDSDLAKPGLSKLLDIRGQKGLTDYLSGEVKDIGSLFKRTDIPKLTVLGAGSSHSRSTELLASRTMAHLLDELAQRYPDRMIIFDSPPLLATTESVVLSRQMGQICLVVESSGTPQYMVKQALGSLHSTDNVSLILNKVKPDLLSTGYGYGYGYGQGYGEKA
jgi:protein-tyrosine kinase